MYWGARRLREVCADEQSRNGSIVDDLSAFLESFFAARGTFRFCPVLMCAGKRILPLLPHFGAGPLPH